MAEPRGAGCPPSLPLEVTQLKVPWEALPQGADSPQSHLLARGQEQHPFLGFSGAGCRRPHHPRLPGRVCLGEGTRAVDLPSRRLPGRAEGWPAQNGNSEETGSGSRHRALLPTVLSSAGSLPRPGLRAFAGVGGGKEAPAYIPRNICPTAVRALGTGRDAEVSNAAPAPGSYSLGPGFRCECDVFAPCLGWRLFQCLDLKFQ